MPYVDAYIIFKFLVIFHK